MARNALLRNRLSGGASRWALALGALGAVASGPAQACFFISGGSVQFNPGLNPPCPSGFFNDSTSAQAALAAMMGGGGPTTTPTPPPSASPSTPTTSAPSTPVASSPATTTITSDNVRQIMGSTLANGTGVGFSAGLSLQASALGNQALLIPVDYGSSGFDTGRPLYGSGYGDFSGYPSDFVAQGHGAYDFSDGGGEIAFEVRGVSDNGLTFSGRIEIGGDPEPLSQAERNEAVPGADSDRALSNFGLLLFTDEAPSDGGDDFFDFIGAFGPRAADGSGPGTGLRGADGERVQSLLNELGYDPPETPSDTRLSGGALYSGDFPSDGDLVLTFRGVADNGLEYGVNLDFGNL